MRACSRGPLVFSLILICAAIVLAAAPTRAQGTPPSLEDVLKRVGAYVAAYGEKASLIVGVEKYTQSLTFEGANEMQRPRRLVAEFAIVKAAGGWVGFRDVVEVNGEKVADRRDRLMSILTDASADAAQVTKIANESARYNVGPVSRNFNVPTAALFFFQPENIPRFTFTKKGTKKTDGVEVWEIDFKETKAPSMIVTRAGVDVPMVGTLWVVPDDGTVVRTRMVMRNFADQMTSPVQGAPSARPPVNPNTPTGGREALNSGLMGETLDWKRIDSSADVDVTYERHDTIGLWLPAKMTEVYAGPIPTRGKPPVNGRASTRATYGEFKQFGTGANIVIK